MTESKMGLRRRIRQLVPRPAKEQVLAHILSHPWFLEAEYIMAYCAIPPEIDLTDVLEAVLDQNKILVLPRCEENGQMTARRIRGLEELAPGAYGILEPGPETEILPPEKLQLILVPGLAFDEKGRRLGRGKGYYDRFLSRTAGKKLGVCGCLLPEVPVEPHDIRMDAVVTDQMIMICEMEDSPC